MSNRTVIVSEGNTEVVDTCSVLMFGVADKTYPAKRFAYTAGEISEIRLYSDAAATQLAERRVIARVNGQVTSIGYFDAADALLHTRTFAYVDGALTGVSGT